MNYEFYYSKSNYYSIQRGSVNLCICNFLRKHDTNSTSVSSFLKSYVISAFFTVYRQGGIFKFALERQHKKLFFAVSNFFCDTEKKIKSVEIIHLIYIKYFFGAVNLCKDIQYYQKNYFQVKSHHSANKKIFFSSSAALVKQPKKI